MSDFVPPPSGPPPPKVPEGWKAQWNEQYSEWFYVNIYTKKSQWEKPTEPVYPPQSDSTPPPGAPPGYVESSSSNASGAPGSHHTPVDHKTNPYETKPNVESDEEMARRLQAEEDARAVGTPGSRNAQSDYMNTPMPGYDQSHSPNPQQGGSPYPPQPNYAQQSYGQPQGSSYPNELPPREQQKKGGFLGKLLGKATGGSSHGSSFRPPGGGYPQQQYYGGQPHYGGYPQQGYGPPGMMGGGGYGRPMMGSGKKPGMGTAGAAALGVGGGLIGGAMLANAFDDDHDYAEGYQDAMQDQNDFDDGGGFDGGFD